MIIDFLVELITIRPMAEGIGRGRQQNMSNSTARRRGFGEAWH